MKRRVTFMGGPLDGKTKLIRVKDMADYVGYKRRGREHLYKHHLRHKHDSDGALVLLHRYEYMGPNAKLPDDVEEI